MSEIENMMRVPKIVNEPEKYATFSIDDVSKLSRNMILVIIVG